MKKSSTTKTKEIIEEASPIKEQSQTEKTGITKKMTKMISSKEIIEKLNSLNIPNNQIRIVIDDLDEKVKTIVNELWDTDYQFIVSGESPDLGKINFEMINRSRSMGRWRVVTPSQAILEPCELFLHAKEYDNAIFKSIPAREKINLFS